MLRETRYTKELLAGRCRYPAPHAWLRRRLSSCLVRTSRAVVLITTCQQQNQSCEVFCLKRSSRVITLLYNENVVKSLSSWSTLTLMGAALAVFDAQLGVLQSWVGCIFSQISIKIDSFDTFSVQFLAASPRPWQHQEPVLLCYVLVVCPNGLFHSCH